MPGTGPEMHLEFSEKAPGGAFVKSPTKNASMPTEESKRIMEAINAALNAPESVVWNHNFASAAEAFPGVPKGEPMR